jgi:hypothetical protein
MAMKAKGSSRMYESPQAAPTEMATAVSGGDSPTKLDIEKSANARAQKRHEVKGDEFADMNVLPSSGGEVLDKAGIRDSGYLVKKDLPYGINVFYNTLPPGMDIEDQEIADIRKQECKYVTDLSYPGDGWTGS